MEPCKLFCNCTFNWVIKSEVNGVTHTLVHQVKLVNRTRKTQFLAWFNVSMTLLSQKMKKEKKKIINVSYTLTLAPSCADFSLQPTPTDPSPPKSTNYPFITKAKIGPKTKVHISQQIKIANQTKPVILINKKKEEEKVPNH